MPARPTGSIASFGLSETNFLRPERQPGAPVARHATSRQPTPRPVEEQTVRGNATTWHEWCSETIRMPSTAVKDGDPTPVPALVRLTSGLAHEIRNPLNSAKLQLDVLDRPPLAEGLPHTVLERIRAALSELVRISDLVDDYTSLTEPRAVEVRPIRLPPFITKCVERLTRSMDLGENLISLSVPAELPHVWADEPQLDKVIRHLLRNSLDACHARPAHIEIAVESRANWVEVTVRDDGPGVPSIIYPLSDVFLPFVTTKRAGTGLGLTIVRQLVLAHGGDVSLRSDSSGTEVQFTLPTAH